jgi:hypothetical protein
MLPVPILLKPSRSSKAPLRRAGTILFLENRRFSAASPGELQIINIRAIYSQQIFKSGKFNPNFSGECVSWNYFICFFGGGVKR